ncbi:translation initiation factor IF-1 [Paenibacillus sp. PvP094]
MLMDSIQHKRLIEIMKSLPLKQRYTKADLLINDLKLGAAGNVEMYYSPHNDYINSSAKVMLVGITPGWQQMEIAYRTAIQALKHQATYETACQEAKFAARMAGVMRTNVIRMLQEIGLHQFLNVRHVSTLFDSECTILHTTSLIRYPIFVKQQNYTGHQPAITHNPFLYDAVLGSFLPEWSQLDEPLVIPLGKSVEAVLRQLLEEKRIREKRILWGFPHPSGANGYRLKQFQQNKADMQYRLSNLHTTSPAYEKQ